MEFTPNPFINRGVITDPAEFFGRKEQIDDITTRLHTMQSTSVVGERRIGKSSLLYHLAQIGPQKMNDPSYRFLYFDLLDAHFHTAVGFLQTILKKLDAGPEDIKAENRLDQNLIAFSDHIETLQGSGQHIVLCLDEFESTFKHPDQFTEDFFNHMRSQLSHRKLAFVTATGHTLQQLSLEGKLTSPFYNIFTVIELKEFTEAEAKEFIAAQHRKVQFDEAELQSILSYLPLHPLKLQIFCDWVIRNRQRKLSEWALEEEILKEYDRFFVDTFDRKQFRRLKKVVSPDNIKRVLETLRTGMDLFSGPKKS